jgi:hypothetical protein
MVLYISVTAVIADEKLWVEKPLPACDWIYPKVFEGKMGTKPIVHLSLGPPL